MESVRLEWDRLERLRAPQSLCVALKHLGLFRVDLVRKEMRSETERDWIRVGVWLKDTHPFMETLNNHEVGAEVVRKFQQELQEESYRLQETVIKSNHFGITEMLVPLVLRGERIGFLSVGGFVTESPLPGDVVLEDRFKILMLDPEKKQKAIKDWRALPYFTPDKRAIVIQMMELLGREVIQFFEETMTTKEREEAVTRNTFSQMVTSNQMLRSLLKKLPQIAASPSAVLIFAEPGSGRELLARMIHNRSPRAQGQFRALHCSSVSENMVEAELLGYEKGAFIGAYNTKAGLLEVCRGGTLYLNEIGDLSLGMQLKILKFLQDKSFSRLGSQDVLQSDVRIMASSQRNLRKLVQMGAFREDLYFLLSVVELEIPPLRQRKEDIPLLAEHFLQQFAKTMSKEGIQWKEDALFKLASHAFPGNVRELRNEVERLVALKDSHSFIEVADLSAKMLEELSPVEEIEKGKTLKELVDEYEKRIISDALAKYHWNKSRVAELFQITRQGLLKKITKFKLDKRKRI